MDHRDLIGARVEIPAHYDLWMRGARFGNVCGGNERFVRVRMDHKQVRKQVRINRADWCYMRVVGWAD